MLQQLDFSIRRMHYVEGILILNQIDELILIFHTFYLILIVEKPRGLSLIEFFEFSLVLNLSHPNFDYIIV